jgi:LysM repeat protein
MALKASLGQKHQANPYARENRVKTKTAAKTSPANKVAAKKVVSNKSTAKDKTHKVASGDNLVTLAKRYGLSSDDIAKANNLVNKNKLKPGQTLVIPVKAKDTKVAKSKVTKKAGSSKTKIVKATSKSRTKVKTKVKPKPKPAKSTKA